MYIIFIKDHPVGIASGKIAKVTEKNGSGYINDGFAEESDKQAFEKYQDSTSKDSAKRIQARSNLLKKRSNDQKARINKEGKTDKSNSQYTKGSDETTPEEQKKIDVAKKAKGKRDNLKGKPVKAKQ